MWLLLLGCPKAPISGPVEPEPVDGSMPDVDPVTPARTLSLTPRVYRPAAFTPARPVDVLIPDLEHLEPTRNDVHGVCVRTPCLLPHVVPGEVIALTAQEARGAEVTLLALPRSTPLDPNGTTRLTPTLLATDARGPTYAGSFTLDSPAEVTITWRAAHDGPGHTGVHQPSLELYGGMGRTQAHTMGTFDPPTQRQYTWSLGAGAWFVRGYRDDDVSRYWCEPNDFVHDPPAWCDPEPDDAVYDLEVELLVEPGGRAETPLPQATVPVLDLGAHTLPVPVEPDPVGESVLVTPGEDVVVRWSPRRSTLTYRWELGEDEWARGACTEWPCVFPAARFHELWIGAPNTREAEEPVVVEVFTVPPPEPLDGLTPGYVLSTTLTERPGDPRPAFADIALTIDTPGTYRLGVKVEQEPVPQLEPLPGTWNRSLLNLMNASDGYDAIFMEVVEPGVFVARVTACEGCAPLPIEFELQAE